MHVQECLDIYWNMENLPAFTSPEKHDFPSCSCQWFLSQRRRSCIFPHMLWNFPHKVKRTDSMLICGPFVKYCSSWLLSSDSFFEGIHWGSLSSGISVIIPQSSIKTGINVNPPKSSYSNDKCLPLRNLCFLPLSNLYN